MAQGGAPAELELQEQQLMQLYYQGKLSMEDYMRATLPPLIDLNTQTVAVWVQRYIRISVAISCRAFTPPPANAYTGTASV